MSNDDDLLLKYALNSKNYNDTVILYLKNYSVKTLIAEYEAMILLKPQSLSDWTVRTVKWLEEY